ncbi:MAG: type II toxin-antitoxin system tRNA(fMet)-specific endonuclease VapC [Solidesulfovibrio sp. DCME]|uniref:type II toxin-antitoxin system tRNA(fMet)-specific endonuclease VapC n=1 Tax=Solidesulfovibrio sp. DCME TaxID=3447380 RepID=UPI003D1227E8
MRYLLDTNICIYLIKHHPPQVRARFAGLSYGDVAISAITVAELEYGVAKSVHREKNAAALQGFLLPLEVLSFDAAAGACYGALRADLERRGEVIGAMDMLIAAQALAAGLVVVTNNVREFSRVLGLHCENWI